MNIEWYIHISTYQRIFVFSYFRISMEPWPHEQYRTFFGLSDPDEQFDYTQAIECLATMYDKGMYDAFVNIINQLSENATICDVFLFKNWLELYHDYVVAPYHIPNNWNELILDYKDRRHLGLLQSNFYFITTTSDSGTSETGKIISISDVESTPLWLEFPTTVATITFSELLQFTSARIPKLPFLKDLGLLQVQNTDVVSDYPLYCWLDNTRYLLIPCKSKQVATILMNNLNNLNKLMFDINPAKVHTICLHDMIVKITPDNQIYTKVMKTYYCIQAQDLYVQPITNVRMNVNANVNANIERFALARSILGITKKTICLGRSATDDYRPMFFKCNRESELYDYSLPTADLCAENRNWLRDLRNRNIITQQSNISYDRLSTEYL